MHYDPPFLPAPPLARALERLGAPEEAAHLPGESLSAAPARYFVCGSAALQRSLARRGLHSQQWSLDLSAPVPPDGVAPTDVLVLYDALSASPEPEATLQALVSALPGHCRVALCEPASWGRLGRWLANRARKALGRPVLGMDPSTLAALCLNSGLTCLRQTWPQGLRSLVLITGRVHPVAGAPSGAGTGPMEGLD